MILGLEWNVDEKFFSKNLYGIWRGESLSKSAEVSRATTRTVLRGKNPGNKLSYRGGQRNPPAWYRRDKLRPRPGISPPVASRPGIRGIPISLRIKRAEAAFVASHPLAMRSACVLLSFSLRPSDSAEPLDGSLCLCCARGSMLRYLPSDGSSSLHLVRLFTPALDFSLGQFGLNAFGTPRRHRGSSKSKVNLVSESVKNKIPEIKRKKEISDLWSDDQTPRRRTHVWPQETVTTDYRSEKYSLLQA